MRSAHAHVVETSHSARSGMEVSGALKLYAPLVFVFGRGGAIGRQRVGANLLQAHATNNVGHGVQLGFSLNLPYSTTHVDVRACQRVGFVDHVPSLVVGIVDHTHVCHQLVQINIEFRASAA